MNPGRSQKGDEDLKEPKRKKSKPGVVLKNPYPIILWNKLGIPPCNDLWPTYCGIFDGESVIIEYPEDMSDIYSMGYFGKRVLCHRGHEPSIRDLPVLRERQWRRRVEWAADFGFELIPAEENQEEDSSSSHQSKADAASPAVEKDDKCDPPAKESKTAKVSEVDEGNMLGRNGKVEEKEKKVELSNNYSDISESDEPVIAQDERSASDDCVKIQEDSSGEVDCCVVDEISDVGKSEHQQKSDEEVKGIIKDSAESESKQREVSEVVESESKEGEKLVKEVSVRDVEGSRVEMDKFEQNTERKSADDEERNLGLEETKESELDTPDNGEVTDQKKERCDGNHQAVDGDESELGGASGKATEMEGFSEKVADNGEGKDPREELENERHEGNEVHLESSTVTKGVAETSNNGENNHENNGEGDDEMLVEEKEEVTKEPSTDSQEKRKSNLQTEDDMKITELNKELNQDDENVSNLNDSITSVEIIEEGKNNATPEKSNKRDDENVREKVRKRSLEGGVVEVEICDEGEVGVNGNSKKKMRISSTEEEDVEESGESENSGRNKESVKEGRRKTLGEIERDKKREEVKKSSEEELNSSIDCEIVDVEDERTSGNESSEEKSKLVEERNMDSDDDIMEVSMEEENRVINSKTGNIKDKHISERFLNEIRKKLPSDVVLLQMGDRKASAKTDGGKISNSKKVCREVPEDDDDDDDDIIEIDLQKDEMLELESTDEDGSMDCQFFDSRTRMQKMKRGKRGSFRKGGRPTEWMCNDEVKSVEMDKQSLIRNKLENDCDVSPCIVIPDTDSEDENPEMAKVPHLESDPSVYLPSLDILRLLPEEAFFLAYGLGCLEVWDGRITKSEVDAKDAENAKKRNVIQDCHKVVKKEDGKRQQKQDDPVVESSVNNSSTKLKKENLIKVSNSSENCETSDAATPKTCSVSDQIEVPSSVPLSCNSNDVHTIDSEEEKKDSGGEIGNLGSSEQIKTTPNDKTDVNKGSENSLGGSDKPGESTHRSKTSREKDTCTIRDTEHKNTDSCREKENGSITVIDLADSPPRRQWGDRKGWSSSDDDDDDDVINVDHPNMSSPIPRNTGSHQMPESSLNCSHDRAMSLIDLWNAFRLSRSSTSPSSTPFETSYAVYHHFRAKRWVIKPGIRFGGDFLLYKDGPSFYHASYLVIIDSSAPHEKSKLNWNALAGMNRLAENVAKDLMICRVEWPEFITETQLRSPKCLAGLMVEEILVRRWISVKERESHEEVFDVDKDCDFVPFEL